MPRNSFGDPSGALLSLTRNLPTHRNQLIHRDLPYPSRIAIPLSFWNTPIPRNSTYPWESALSLGMIPFVRTTLSIWITPTPRNSPSHNPISTNPIHLDHSYATKLRLSRESIPLLRNLPNPLDPTLSLGTTLSFRTTPIPGDKLSRSESPYPSRLSLPRDNPYLSKRHLSVATTRLPQNLPNPGTPNPLDPPLPQDHPIHPDSPYTLGPTIFRSTPIPAPHLILLDHPYPSKVHLPLGTNPLHQNSTYP